MTDRRAELEAERKAVQSMLDGLHEDAVIDRRSFQDRLEQLTGELERLEGSPWRPPPAQLVFDGAPVLGSRAVFADFASDLLSTFTEAVTRIASSIEYGPLAAMGPVPNRANHRILVTGIARGSFGFQLEPVLPSDQTGLTHAPMAEALESALEFLENTNETDERLSDAISSMDDRALDQMRVFLDKLQKNEAICGLSIGKRSFRFANTEAIRTALSRIGGENVVENEVERALIPLGVLPHNRRIEFRWTDSHDIHTARVAAQVDDPAVLNEHLGQTVNATLRERRLGDATPRYTLLDFDVGTM